MVLGFSCLCFSVSYFFFLPSSVTKATLYCQDLKYQFENYKNKKVKYLLLLQETNIRTLVVDN